MQNILDEMFWKEYLKSAWWFLNSAHSLLFCFVSFRFMAYQPLLVI